MFGSNEPSMGWCDATEPELAVVPPERRCTAPNEPQTKRFETVVVRRSVLRPACLRADEEEARVAPLVWVGYGSPRSSVPWSAIRVATSLNGPSVEVGRGSQTLPTASC